MTGTIHLKLSPVRKPRSETKNTEGFWKLSFKDDGNGLPEGYDINSNTSMGSQIIISLIQQLHASLKVQNKKGAQFEIIFTRAEEE